MTNNRFDFTHYTNDELEFVRNTLVKAMDAFAVAEIALTDAHILHDSEPTLTNWIDLFNALKETEKAIDKR